MLTVCPHSDGNGGWDGRGCRKYNTTPDYTTCLCDHLTHFGVLLVRENIYSAAHVEEEVLGEY